MAGSIVTTPANTEPDTTDWQALIAWIEKVEKGKHNLTLTNMEVQDYTEPAIAAGSLIEVNGSFYSFGTEESITGWSGISDEDDAYIKVVPSSSSITAEFTSTAPTWSDSKQGWYDGNDRYVAYVWKESSTGYRCKQLLKDGPQQSIKGFFEADLDTDDLYTAIESDIKFIDYWVPMPSGNTYPNINTSDAILPVTGILTLQRTLGGGTGDDWEQYFYNINAMVREKNITGSPTAKWYYKRTFTCTLIDADTGNASYAYVYVGFTDTSFSYYYEDPTDPGAPFIGDGNFESGGSYHVCYIYLEWLIKRPGLVDRPDYYHN
jgi:hypothetical protein